MKEVNQRRCISCRKLFDRNMMLRVVREKNNNVIVWLEGHVDGRSAYVCRQKGCLSAARKGKKFEKVLKISLPDNFWEGFEREQEWLKNAQVQK